MTTKSRKPITGAEDQRELFRELAKQIPGMTTDEMIELMGQLKPLRAADVSEAEHENQKNEAQQRTAAPQTDDELHALIKKLTGYDIPRVAVCSDHCAPFDPIADAYFNRENALLVMASRESGKTLTVSVLHFINAETKPGIEGITFGAIKPQAARAYQYVKDFVFSRDEEGNRVPKPQILGEPTREKTEWKTGSIIQLIVGTRSGVNSPHPQVVHADELDLMEEEVFAESRNMSSSKTLAGGRRIPALDIVTSTRKSTRGLMQQLLDETEEAVEQGHKPPWKVYAFCYKESAAEAPHCQMADPVARIRRLMELGRSPAELCACDKVVKGEWGPNHPRTLASCCRGDLFDARGWMHLDDIERKFMANSPAVWEAQMECRRPMADGLYLPTFSRVRHCVRQWVPRPEYGRITMGVDWGGAAPSVVLWVQGPTPQPIEITGFSMQPIVVPQGSYVVFRAKYWIGRVGATSMADHVVTQELQYRDKFPGWRVRGRFADMAGAQSRNDWHEHRPPLRTHWYVKNRDFDPSLEAVQGLMMDNLLYIDVVNAPELADDCEAWRSKKGKEVHDDSTHGPAALRYDLQNVTVDERRRGGRTQGEENLPVVQARGTDTLDRAGMAPAAAASTSPVDTEQWRKNMGMMTTNPGSEGWRLP
jgi:hypothetical protein